MRLSHRIFRGMRYYEGTHYSAHSEIAVLMSRSGVLYRTALGEHEIGHICALIGISVPQYRAERGDILHFLTNSSEEVLAWGWSTNIKLFHISEIELYLHPRGREVLYDFVTPTQNQRRGYHMMLLNAVFEGLSLDRKAIIFALPENAAPHIVYNRLQLRHLPNWWLFLKGDIRMPKVVWVN